MKRPDIYNYHDYRLFLKEWFEYLKSKKMGFSLRTIAKQGGPSSSFLSMVLNHQRNLSPAQFMRFELLLGLDHLEIDYFKVLLELNDSKDHQHRVESLRKLRSFPKYMKKKHSETEVFHFLQRWYNVVIREMTEFGDFSEEPSWIKSRIRFVLDSSQVESALEFLKKFKFLEYRSGRLKHSERPLNCQTGVFKISLREFHQQMTDRIFEAIEDVDSSERLMLGFTAAFGNKDFAEACRILNDCIAQLEELKSRASVQMQREVYHFMVAGVPMTKGSQRGDS